MSEFYKICCLNAKKAIKRKVKRMKTIDKCIEELEYVKASIDSIEAKVNVILDLSQSDYYDAKDEITDIARCIKGIIGGCLYEN